MVTENTRINPDILIPAEATAIHGITNADVAHEPKFKQYAKSILDFLDDCDIAGFNVIKFDLPFIEAEFRRAGVEFSRQNRYLVDSQVIYHLMDPRNLEAAYLKYCGKKLEAAHTTEGDATASVEILDGQLETHHELPKNVADLCALCYKIPENYIDLDGNFIWSDGEVVCNFGKHNGHKLEDLVAEDPDYLIWIAEADFTPEVKDIATRALLGEFPKLP